MLAMICHKPLWINRLVTMVQGLVSKPTGCNPRRKMSFGAIAVTINSRRFAAISIPIGVGLKLW